MGDEWFGHRSIWGTPEGDRKEMTDWDFALIEAVQTIEDHTDANGLLKWETDEDGVSVNSIKTFDKFQASIDRKTSAKGYKALPGERWVPDIRPAPGRDGEFQTFKEYRESQAENS